jgi:hypothetical protein
MTYWRDRQTKRKRSCEIKSGYVKRFYSVTMLPNMRVRFELTVITYCLGIIHKWFSLFVTCVSNLLCNEIKGNMAMLKMTTEFYPRGDSLQVESVNSCCCHPPCRPQMKRSSEVEDCWLLEVSPLLCNCNIIRNNDEDIPWFSVVPTPPPVLDINTENCGPIQELGKIPDTFNWNKNSVRTWHFRTKVTSIW